MEIIISIAGTLLLGFAIVLALIPIFILLRIIIDISF